MTSLGYRKVSGAATQITAFGSSYSEVDRIRWSDFGGSGSTRWAFLVWARAGDIDVLLGSPNRAQIEVGLGIPGKFEPSLSYMSVIADLNWGPLQRPQQGHQMFFLLYLDGTARDWGSPVTGNWVANDDLALYARIAPNGDTGLVPTFTVSDISWLAIDLDALDTAGIGYSHDVTPLTYSTTNQLFASGWTNLFEVDPGAGSGEEWLHFGYLRYSPRAGPGASAGPPHFQMGESTSGFANFNPLVGTDRFGRFEQRPGASTSPRVEYHEGCFFPHLTPSTANRRLAFRGRDMHALSSQRTLVTKAAVFSVQAERFAYWNSRLVTSYPTAVGAHSTVGRFYPFEVVVPEASDFTVLHQGIFDHQGGNGQERNFSPYALTDTSLRQLRTPTLHALCRHPEEGIPATTMLAEAISGAPGTPTESRYQFHWWGVPGGGAENWPLRDVATVGFFLDDDPSNISAPPVAPVAPVVIDPGTESPDPGSLSTLPIAPDGPGEEQTPEVPIEEFRSDTGYARTWPRFVQVRKVMRWSFTKLVLTERQQLEDFFHENPTFAYTPPGASAANAYAIMSLPQWRDVGSLHSASFDVALLTNTG